MKRFFTPNKFIGFIIFNVSIILMIYVLGFNHEDDVISYVTYALSTYCLIMFCIWFVRVCKKLNTKIKEHKVYKLYNNNMVLVTKASLYVGAILNFVYFIFKLSTGIYYKSAWFITFSVYYFLLIIMKAVLLKDLGKKDFGSDKKKEYKKLGLCGVILLFLDVVLTGMIILIIHQNQSIDYAGYIIYLVALYDFYLIITAFINVFKYHKKNSPALLASKCINLSVALISMLSLEVAMISRFGDASDTNFRYTMITLSGFAVCLINSFMAIYMIVKARKNTLKEKDSV